MPVTRPSLTTSFCIRRHGDRIAALRATRDRHAVHDRSWYVPGDAGFDGFGQPRRAAREMNRPAQAIRDALARRAPVTDAEIDQVFPEELRDRSYLHWTPVAIAVRAAELLVPDGSAPGQRILDVGAGVGKQCIVGAAVTGATWWGIEQDAIQVAAATHAAWELGVDRQTRFVHGDGSRLAWDEFDGFYFYNPFTTLMLAPHASPFMRYATIQGTLRRVEQRLASARAGTRVVTYHGFGGKLPTGYTLITREPVGSDALELWLRDAPPAASVNGPG